MKAQAGRSALLAAVSRRTSLGTEVPDCAGGCDEKPVHRQHGTRAACGVAAWVRHRMAKRGGGVGPMSAHDICAKGIGFGECAHRPRARRRRLCVKQSREGSTFQSWLAGRPAAGGGAVRESTRAARWCAGGRPSPRGQVVHYLSLGNLYLGQAKNKQAERVFEKVRPVREKRRRRDDPSCLP